MNLLFKLFFTIVLMSWGSISLAQKTNIDYSIIPMVEVTHTSKKLSDIHTINFDKNNSLQVLAFNALKEYRFKNISILLDQNPNISIEIDSTFANNKIEITKDKIGIHLTQQKNTC